MATSSILTVYKLLKGHQEIKAVFPDYFCGMQGHGRYWEKNKNVTVRKDKTQKSQTKKGRTCLWLWWGHLRSLLCSAISILRWLWMQTGFPTNVCSFKKLPISSSVDLTWKFYFISCSVVGGFFNPRKRSWITSLKRLRNKCELNVFF